MDCKIEILNCLTDGFSVQENVVFPFHLHGHIFYEMTFYEPFDGKILINGKAFSGEHGLAVLMTPMAFHRIEVNEAGGAHFIKVAFNHSIFKEGQNLPRFPVIVDNTRDNPFLCSAFRQLVKQRYARNCAAALIYAIVCVICADGENITCHFDSSKEIVKILSEIDSSYTHPMSLGKIAESAGLTPQYFSAYFRKKVGIGFSVYIQELRLRYAAGLLIDGNANISEICDASGYRNLSHFLRSFHKFYGMTPKQYRVLNMNSKSY